MNGLPQLVALIGRPLSPLYRAVMRARQSAYETGVLSSFRLDVPVISIGNLTMGGSGKTPMVMAVAKMMQKEERNPAIISRGYGGNSRKDINLVSDGTNILMNAHEAGDEPLLMAESLPGIPVVTGSKRVLTGRYAVKELGADLIILDDGFQHLALQRDLDLVLFKAPELLGDGRVFPGGYLREPVSALARADAFVITGVEKSNEDKVEEFAGYLEGMFPERLVIKVGYSLGTPLDMNKNEMNDFSFSDRYFAFAGLADSESFRKSLEKAGYNISGFRSFPDHHAYTEADIEMLGRDAGGLRLLTTEKDIVKLKGRSFDLPIHSVRLSVDTPGEFDQYLQTFIKDRCKE